MDWLYIADFPETSRAIVEVAQLKARKKLQPWVRRQDLLGYVLRVWSAFTKEACRLGLERNWKLERVREASEEFLRLMTIEACSREGYELSDMVSNWNGSILPEVLREYQRSSEWSNYERALLRVAKTQSTPPKKEQRTESRESGDDCAKERRSAVDAYIAEVHKKTGKLITRTDIWKRVGYKSRSAFEAWERCDPKRPNKTAVQRFAQLLKDKPHLETKPHLK